MKHIFILVLVLILGMDFNLQGQGCGFTISTPNDITICEPGNISLNGSLSGNYLGFNWTGPGGYFNNQNLNPSVFINQTSTFKLKAFGDPLNNLIVNGDFSSGNTGFSTDYLYQPDLPGITTELWPEGTYSITSNPNFVHTYFSNCSDHAGGGNMMVVNGAASYSRVWCQTVAVTPNTTYIFQAFAASVEPTSPAILQFSINGNLLGSPFNLTSTTCRWDEFYVIWDSGAATSVDICITNQNLAGSGNDFAIDDIFFGPLCQDEKEFTVTLSEFSLAPSSPKFLSCLNPETTLTAQPFPFNGNYTYSWFTQDGSITGRTDQADLSINGGGTYFVTVTDAAGCTHEQVFDVYGDFTKPDVSISGDNLLSCTKKSTSLSVHSLNNFHDVVWTLPDFSETHGNSIKATSPGHYIVQVTGDNGCINTASLDVEFEKSQFIYQKDKSGTLTCSMSNINLYLDVTSKFDSIKWHGPKIIKQNSGRDTITVEKPGYYVFELFLGEDCSVKDSIKVDLQPSLIQYKIPDTDTITCLKTSVNITPDSLVGVKNIVWDISGKSPIDQDTLKVTQKGFYHFTLTDINGCTKSDSIQVLDNIEKPLFTVDITPIECKSNTGSFVVKGSGLTEYLWSGQNNTSSSPNPVFSEEGNYTLIVTGINSCKDTMIYYLPSSKDFPDIKGNILPITCTNPQGSIEINTSLPSDIVWSGPNGTSGTGMQISSSLYGVYKITATTKDGCKSEESFIMPIDTIKPQLQPIKDFLLTCNQDTYKPVINHSTFNNHLWEGPGINSGSPLDIIINTPGIYSLTLYNANGCTVKKSFTVTENKKAPSFGIVAGDLSCKNPTTPLIVSGDPLKYLVLNGDTIQRNFAISQPGSYTFTGINELGCKANFILNVKGSFDLPKIDLNPILLNCYAPQKWIKNIGVDQNLNISWETANGVIQQDSILITSAESVTLIAINDAGCKSKLNAVITTDFVKPDIKIDGADVIKCTEEFITIKGLSSTAKSFEWKDENGQILDTNPTLSVTKSGIYSLICANLTNGCTNTTIIAITKQPSPDHILFTEKQPLCFGEKGQFAWSNGSGGTPPYTLQLNNKNISSNKPEELTSGLYSIVLADANGCTKRDTLIINQLKDFAVDAGRDTIIQLGSSYQLYAFSTLNQQDIKEIIWNPANSLSCNNCLNPLATPDTDTRYTVTIYNANGCVKEDHVTVRVKFVKGYIAPNIFRPDSRQGNQKFTIYPIENSIRKIKILNIYDRWGNLMFTTKDIEPAKPNEGWNGTFLGRDVQPGVYVWKAEIEYKDDSTEIGAGDITIIR